MTSEQYYILAEEIRADNQVPPYTNDEVIINSIMKCERRLDMLKPGADFAFPRAPQGLRVLRYGASVRGVPGKLRA